MNLDFTKKKSIRVICFVLLGLFWATLVLNMCSPTIMLQFTQWTSFLNVFCAIIRWISYLSIITFTVSLLYNKKAYNYISVFIALPALVISLCASGQYLSLFQLSNFYIATHFIFHALGILFGIYILLSMKIQKESASFWLGTFLRTFPLLLLGIIPLNIFMSVPALMNSEFLIYKIFGAWHLFFIILLVCVTFIFYFVLKRKSKEDAQIALFIFSLILVYQLLTRFSVVSTGSYQALNNIFAALPLYICSFGIVLLPFAIASKNKFFQTMLFLVNTPGAFLVFIYLDPGAGFSILHYNVTYFVFNHLFLFALVSMLPRFCNAEYKFKNLLHLLYISAIYFVVLAILNNICILNGFNPNYSYVSACPLPLGPITEIGKFTIFNMTFSPVYLLVLYLFHMAVFTIGLCIYRLILLISHKITKKKVEQV